MFHQSFVYVIIVIKKREKKGKESIDFAFWEVQVSSCNFSNQS
jgi:hypothetical protein